MLAFAAVRGEVSEGAAAGGRHRVSEDTRFDQVATTRPCCRAVVDCADTRLTGSGRCRSSRTLSWKLGDARNGQGCHGHLSAGPPICAAKLGTQGMMCWTVHFRSGVHLHGRRAGGFCRSRRVSAAAVILQPSSVERLVSATPTATEVDEPSADPSRQRQAPTRQRRGTGRRSSASSNVETTHRRHTNRNADCQSCRTARRATRIASRQAVGRLRRAALP